MKRLAVKKGIANVVVLLFSLCTSAVLCEIILRSFHPSGFYVWKPGTKTISKPAPGLMPGITGESRFFINSEGLRGDPFSEDQTYRILALGGSTTECFYLDESEAWPYLVQKFLNEELGEHRIWVGNVGRSGHDTRNHILQIEKLLPQYPKVDAVILMIGINDLIKRLAMDDRYRQMPPFKSLDVEWYNKLQSSSFAVIPPQLSNEDGFFRRTEIWQRLRNIKNAILPSAQMKTTYQDAGGNIYVAWRENRQNAARMRAEMPDLTSVLVEFEQNVKAMIELARQHNTRPIFITQPSIWRSDLPGEIEDLLWFGGVGNFQAEGRHEYYTTEALARGMEIYNQTLLRICRENDVECIDVAAEVPKDTTEFYDDCHLNEGGAKRVAQVIANFLMQDSRRDILLSNNVDKLENRI